MVFRESRQISARTANRAVQGSLRSLLTFSWSSLVEFRAVLLPSRQCTISVVRRVCVFLLLPLSWATLVAPSGAQTLLPIDLRARPGAPVASAPTTIEVRSFPTPGVPLHVAAVPGQVVSVPIPTNPPRYLRLTLKGGGGGHVSGGQGHRAQGGAGARIECTLDTSSMQSGGRLILVPGTAGQSSDSYQTMRGAGGGGGGTAIYYEPLDHALDARLIAIAGGGGGAAAYDPDGWGGTAPTLHPGQPASLTEAGGNAPNWLGPGSPFGLGGVAGAGGAAGWVDSPEIISGGTFLRQEYLATQGFAGWGDQRGLYVAGAGGGGGAVSFSLSPDHHLGGRAGSWAGGPSGVGGYVGAWGGGLGHDGEQWLPISPWGVYETPGGWGFGSGGAGCEVMSGIGGPFSFSMCGGGGGGGFSGGGGGSYDREGGGGGSYVDTGFLGAATTPAFSLDSATADGFVTLEIEESPVLHTGSVVLTNSIGAGHLARVQLPVTFNDPVVVAYVATHHGGRPVEVRARNVQPSSFDLFLQADNDGAHPYPETVHYMVAEAGRWDCSYGGHSVIIEAGKTHTRLHEWTGGAQMYFSSPMSSPDAPVFHMLNTHNNGRFMTSGVKWVTETGFRIFLERAQTGRPRATETIGWIAMDLSAPVVTANPGHQIFAESLETAGGNGISNGPHAASQIIGPVVIHKLQSRNGGEGGWARGATNLGLGAQYSFVQEDIVADPELFHVSERFATVSFGGTSVGLTLRGYRLD